MEQLMVTVDVRLFATLRRHYPELGVGESMSVRLSGDATIEQLLKELDLPEDQVKVIFVNGKVQKEGYRLSDGDELGIFPPVGGG